MGRRWGGPPLLRRAALAGAGQYRGPHETTWAIVAFAVLAVLGVVAGGRRSVAPLLWPPFPRYSCTWWGHGPCPPLQVHAGRRAFAAVLMGLAWRGSWAGRIPAAVFDRRRSRWQPAVAGQSVRQSGLRAGRLSRHGARIAAEAHPNAGIILVAPNRWSVHLLPP